MVRVYSIPQNFSYGMGHSAAEACTLYNQTEKRSYRNIETGLGVLNTIDSELLMNKLTATSNDIVKLQQPLQSSLLALGTSQ